MASHARCLTVFAPVVAAVSGISSPPTTAGALYDSRPRAEPAAGYFRANAGSPAMDRNNAYASAFSAAS